MINPIEDSDHAAIRYVLAAAIRETVTETEDEAEHLITDVERSLAKWEHTKAKSHHLKHVQDGIITGFVIVKEYWNLSHLFVLPA
jgi:hypothetical protein